MSTWAACPDADLVTQGYGCTDVLSEWIAPECPSGRFHSGIDLGRRDGGWKLYRTPVVATRLSHVVLVGGAVAGYPVDPHVVQYLGDQAVCLYDGAHFILYGHLDQALVHLGQTVTPGTTIGLVGTKGNSTAPHLHLEVRVDGPVQVSRLHTINPAPFLQLEAPPAIVEDVILFRSTERGPDGNPLIFVIDAAGKRHIGGPEFAARQAGGAKIVDMAAADLAQIPDAGALGSAHVSGTLTLG